MPNKKPPAQILGRGMDILFGEDPESAGSVSIDEIDLPLNQPRKWFDPEKLDQLADSIRQHGILGPVLVRSLPNERYELVAGERRYRAAKLAKLEEIPVVIRELSDQEARQIALVENLQREDLNALEETEAVINLLAIKLSKEDEDEVVKLLQRLVQQEKKDSYHNVMVQAEIELIDQELKVLGINWRSFVKNRLPVLHMAEDIKQAIRAGRLAYTKAKAIAAVKDESSRKELLEKAISESLTLSQIKALTTGSKEKDQAEAPTANHVSKKLSEVTKRLRKAKLDPDKERRFSELLDSMMSLFE